jgi:hypothetical protein
MRDLSWAGIKAASASVSLELGREHRLAGLNLDVGHRSRPQASGCLLDDLLDRNQVEHGISCLVEILLGPIMVG